MKRIRARVPCSKRSRGSVPELPSATNRWLAASCGCGELRMLRGADSRRRTRQETHACGESVPGFTPHGGRPVAASVDRERRASGCIRTTSVATRKHAPERRRRRRQRRRTTTRCELHSCNGEVQQPHWTRRGWEFGEWRRARGWEWEFSELGVEERDGTRESDRLPAAGAAHHCAVRLGAPPVLLQRQPLSCHVPPHSAAAAVRCCSWRLGGAPLLRLTWCALRLPSWRPARLQALVGRRRGRQ
jgi:hypothetical protein